MALLVVMLEQFLTGVDVSFMIFLPQSTCRFLFRINFLLRDFVSGLLLCAISACCLFLTLLWTPLILSCFTDHDSSEADQHIGRQAITCYCSFDRTDIYQFTCNRFSIKACLLAEASPPFSEFSPNKKVTCQKGYLLFRQLLPVSYPF